MDKEDCIQLLLSTLQEPRWKCSNSVTDWDLKNILWRAGYMLSPEQADALLADIRRRNLIASRERRGASSYTSLWGVHITQAGNEWLVQRSLAEINAINNTIPSDAASASDYDAPDQRENHPEEAIEVGLQ